jgi:hypothetical protein
LGKPAVSVENGRYLHVPAVFFVLAETRPFPWENLFSPHLVGALVKSASHETDFLVRKN